MNRILRICLVQTALLAGLWVSSCEALSGAAVYTPELPPLPDAWAALLPAPSWRFEWIDPAGRKMVLKTGAGESPRLSFLAEYASPVLAFPYWPERNLPPALMRPAGAVVPFDIRGDRLSLSWRGGVDAWVYREMAAALAVEGKAGTIPPQRRPELFDWPRFRELLEDPVLAEEVRRDPWVVDWTAVSRKIIQSGFDRRRLVPEKRKELAIPGFEGPWAGTSPFADPVVAEAGGPLRLKTRTSPETFVSTGGLLRCAGNTWIWIPFDGD